MSSFILSFLFLIEHPISSRNTSRFRSIMGCVKWVTSVFINICYWAIPRFHGYLFFLVLIFANKTHCNIRPLLSMISLSCRQVFFFTLRFYYIGTNKQINHSLTLCTAEKTTDNQQSPAKFLSPAVKAWKWMTVNTILSFIKKDLHTQRFSSL